MKQLIYISTIIILLFSCEKDRNSISKSKSPSKDQLIESESPIDFQTDNVLFYKDIKYGDYERTTYDLFSPNTDTLSPLMIFIHGGGFFASDKSAIYADPNFISTVDSLLSENIAVACINYRFIDAYEGILRSLNDCKRALQHMKFYSKKLQINKDKIILMGGSAGSGASLWIGLNDDMKSTNSEDSISLESTRVQGLVCNSTQANYDLLNWSETIFSEYKSQGLTSDSLITLIGKNYVLRLYGIDSLAELTTPKLEEERARLDYLNALSVDDPEIYLISTQEPYSFPTNDSEVLHHPLHAKAIMDKANSVNVPTKVHLPKMGIDTRDNESIVEFILRKIGISE